MFSANRVAGFFNEPYLQSKSKKWPDLLDIDTNLHKLKDQKKIEWARAEMGLASLVTGL